jgi:hypothetical protein
MPLTAAWLLVIPQAISAQIPALLDDPAISDGQTGEAPAESPAEQEQQSTERPGDQDQQPTTKPDQPGRLFNILPNGSTVEAGMVPPPLTVKQMFTWATEDSFDKNVFPFIAVVTLFGAGQPSERYATRYVTALADNAVANFMATALLPSLLRQDPRYFQRDEGSVFRRSIYAASRVLVTRSRDGQPQFNISEVGGNALAVTISNAYYPAPDRTVRNTAIRLASQVLWDAVGYECKEFWPDIRRWWDKGHHQAAEHTTSSRVLPSSTTN